MPKTIQHSLCCFFIITLSFFLPAVLSAQNLIQNSGFDRGTSYWSTQCSIEIYPETVYGGTDPNNQVTEIDNERCFSQDICVADNTTYTVSLVASRRVDAPPTAGFYIKVSGDSTGTLYVSQTVYRTNTTWQFTPETFTFTIPAGSPDKNITIAFSDTMHQSSYGIILDNIQMHPTPDMSISSNIDGSGIALLNNTYNYSVLNAVTDAYYSWSFDAGSTPGTPTNAASSVSWSSIGTKNIYVYIYNLYNNNSSVCIIAQLTATALVSTILPIQVTSFTGNITADDKAILHWTANEENTNHFVLERSADGIDYKPIAVIFSQNATGPQSHSYTDANYSSPAYYRLQQVDLNGATSYSPIVILKKETNNFTLYPSSPTTILHYSATVKQPAAAVLQIVNAGGQTVITQKEYLYQGVNAQTVDVSQLPAGMYFLKFSIPGNNSSFIKKFNKL